MKLSNYDQVIHYQSLDQHTQSIPTVGLNGIFYGFFILALKLPYNIKFTIVSEVFFLKWILESD